MSHPAGRNRCPCDCAKCSPVLTCHANRYFAGCWSLERTHLSDPQGLALHRSLLLRPASPHCLGLLHSGSPPHLSQDSQAERGQPQGSPHLPAPQGHCSLLLDVLGFEISHFIYFIWFCLLFKKCICFKSIPCYIVLDGTKSFLKNFIY